MLELLSYRDLVAALVARELKVRYRRSTLGFVWTMLQPMMMMGVMYVVFSALFRFAVEFVRGNPAVWLGLSFSQLFLIPTTLVLLAYFVRRIARGVYRVPAFEPAG